MSEPLIPRLTGFRRMRRGLVRESEWLAECLYAESSGFEAEVFYLEAFVLPLFVPTDHLYFTHGFRVGDGSGRVGTDFLDAAVEAMDKLEDLADLKRLSEEARRHPEDVYAAELCLCIGVLVEDRDLIRGSTSRLANWKVKIGWEQAVVDRCRDLISVIDSGDLDEARRKLRGRRDDVARLLN